MTTSQPSPTKAPPTGYRWVHRLSDIDPSSHTGTCANCGPNAPLRYRKDRGRWICKTGEQKRNQIWRAQRDSTLGKSQRRVYQLAKYDLSVEAYDAILRAQGGVCAICFLPCSTGRRLAVDHCHTTGRVRGLLCNPCNRGIGLLRDDPRLAIAAALYLRDVA